MCCEVICKSVTVNVIVGKLMNTRRGCSIVLS